MARYAGLETGARAGGEEELIPLDITGTFAWENYQVRKGDTVSRIAQAHALSYDAVISSNALPNARFLREGEILRLPNMDGIAYKVKAGDSLSRIASSKGIPLETILDANDLESNTIHEGMTLFLPGARMRAEDLQLVLGEVFMYPIRGRLTSPFGWRKDPFTGVTLFHRAVDLAASTGTPVKAARGGKIAYVGNNSVYGKYLILKHPGGYETLYAHLSQVAVAQGREVSQGEKIGEVGSTGYSTGPHLHFAVYKNGRAVNPLDYLNR
jgi:murein DD-endopeptidase MepM/ murein hydrolase activator NlpD